MGTTGLETAFAALFTELVLPGELELVTVIERMTAGGALYGLPTPRIAPRASPPTCAWSTSTRAARSAPTATPAARRTAASTDARCRAGGADAGRRLGRVPGAGAGRGADASDERADRLRPARGRDALRRAGLRRRRAGRRRDRVHDLDVGLSGGDDRPELRRPAAHVHLSADRQLRRVGAGDGVRPRARTRRDHARRRSTATTRRRADRAGSPGSSGTGSRPSPTSTRARWCATSGTGARCAAGCSRPR